MPFNYDVDDDDGDDDDGDDDFNNIFGPPHM